MENEFSIVNTVIAWIDEPKSLELFKVGEHIPREFMFTSGAAYVKIRGLSKRDAEQYILFEAIRLINYYHFPQDYIISQFRRIKEFNGAMVRGERFIGVPVF